MIKQTCITDNPYIQAVLPVLALCFSDNKKPESFDQLLKLLSAVKLSFNSQNIKLDQQAHYMLCSAVDEFLSANSHGLFFMHLAKQSFLLYFHQDNLGGIRFFDLTHTLLENPKQNIMVIELAYLLLTLGFQGQYCIIKDGKQELTNLMEKIKLVLQQERAKPKRLDIPKQFKRSLWRVYLMSFLYVASLGLFMIFQFSLHQAAQPTASLIQQLKLDCLS